MPQPMGLQASDMTERLKLCPGLVGGEEQKLLPAVSIMEWQQEAGLLRSPQPGPTEKAQTAVAAASLSRSPRDLSPIALQLYPFLPLSTWLPSLKEAQGQGCHPAVASVLLKMIGTVGGPVAKTQRSQCRGPGFPSLVKGSHIPQLRD